MSLEAFHVGRYEHPQTESSVTLIGTHHWSTNPEYFERIEAFLSERVAHGDVVHYESTAIASPEKVRCAPKPVQHRHRLLLDYIKYEEETWVALEARSPDLMLEFQYDNALEIDSKWENHDYTTLDLARELSGEVLDAMRTTALAKHWHAVTWGHPDRHAVRLQERLGQKGRALYEKVMIDNRNAFALNALRNTLSSNPTANVTMIWGEAHLPGLGKGLLKMGYTPQNRDSN
jgi:hypothetical protein